MERTESIPTHDAAFDHLTRFYKQNDRDKAASSASKEIDLTGDSDGTPEAGEDVEMAGDGPVESNGDGRVGSLDAVDLAAGVSCKCLEGIVTET